MLAGAIAILAWLALAAQTDLTLHRMLLRGFDTLDALLRLASYLTNLTVLLVALSFTCVTLRVRVRPLRFLAGPAAPGAVTVYIVFVGVAYNVLLRHLWTPHGFRALLNESLHTVLPLLCAVYWLRFVPYCRLSRRERLAWFIYPLGYLVVTFWRGSVTDFYPYPFIDVGELGYARVILNSALLFAAFVVLMAVFTAINARRRPLAGADVLSVDE
ncbi:FAR-17a/AIG1-like protein [Paraburkholderia acidisoli]|uniref:FAR-17a/AIG1-like protein n=1 Tax=Paraburkholderia acidisoli TaxID=2571748 RepID=A0A7Z2GS02_9BURK|nr:FAR-17a/AIG1-like protein [Paraburkholderia acidisoli]